MLKYVSLSTTMLILLGSPVFAQSDHHYQGGPRGTFHHGPLWYEPFFSAPAGRYHYQGGPRSVPHIGEMPNIRRNAARIKRKKKSNLN